jgi:1,4-alpha-glucan branching enzyme
MKKIILILNMIFISVSFSQNVFHVGHKLNITQKTSFVMDGDLDPDAILLSQNGNLELYTGFDGINLYVAGNSATALGLDVFIFVAQNPGNLRSAMWAKTGLVAQWDAYLGAESTNGWSGWVDNAGSANSQTGTVVEGVINVVEEWGTIPDSVFIALATYQTSNGGALAGQAPAGNGNGNIESSEYTSFNLIASLTAILYSPEVNNSFGDPQRSPYFMELGDSVNVAGTFVASFEPLDSLYLYFNDILVEQTDQDTINKLFDTNLYSRGMHEIKLIVKGTTGTKDTAYIYIMINPDVNEAQRPAGIIDGINYNSDTSVTLSLFAPYKEFVYLIGDFNDWKIDTIYYMNRDSVNTDSVHWWLTLNGLTSGQEYAFQYQIDNELRIADPYTEKILDPWNDLSIPPATFPNLMPYPKGKTDYIVSVFQTGQQPFTWVYSDTFQPPPQKNLVIYETLVRDFIQNHDFQTMIDTLDYFQNLGINAIELMPVNEFDGNSSWGYNPVFYFAPDKFYGPAENLKRFIDECHRRDIAVIIDMVLNHANFLYPLVQLYFDFNTWLPTAENPWFNVVSPNPTYFWDNDFDHESPATKIFVDRVTRFWQTEYKVDGFRFDFTKGFTNTPGDGWYYDPARINILKRMADKIWETDSTAYVILEHLTENAEEKELAEYSNGMLLWGNMNYNYNEATMGYHENGKSDFSWGYYGSRGWNKPNLVTYMESHDEERLMYKNVTHGNSSGSYDIQDTTTAMNRIKIAAAFFLTYPGPKMIWQFGELGYDYSIDYNGRVGEKPIRWDYFNNSLDRQNLYKTFAALTKIRRENEVFTDPQTTVNLWLNDTNGRKRIKLTHPSMNVIIIGNFDVAVRNINPDFHTIGMWYDYFSWDSLDVVNVSENIQLLPGEFRIYTDHRLDPPEQGILNSVELENPLTLVESFELAQNFPNPFNPITNIKYNLPVNEKVHLEIFNVIGERVIVLVDENQSIGRYQIQWDGRNQYGKLVASGVYFYRLIAGDYIKSHKMILLR